MKALPKTPASTKRATPDFSGVPGEIVSTEGLPLLFGRGGRTSPYDALLDELAKATDLAVSAGKERPALRFGDAKARASVAIRGKKKGFRMVFAEHGGCLYARIDTSPGDELKGSRRERILGELKAHPGLSAMRLTVILREKGDATVDAQIMESILTQMVRAGEVVKAEGDTYRMSPTRRAVAA